MLFEYIPENCTILIIALNSKVGKKVKINGVECLNLATFNFLGMIGRADIEVRIMQV